MGFVRLVGRIIMRGVMRMNDMRENIIRLASDMGKNWIQYNFYNKSYRMNIVETTRDG
jgi:hypothetical protein